MLHTRRHQTIPLTRKRLLYLPYNAATMRKASSKQLIHDGDRERLPRLCPLTSIRHRPTSMRLKRPRHPIPRLYRHSIHPIRRTRYSSNVDRRLIYCTLPPLRGDDSGAPHVVTTI